MRITDNVYMLDSSKGSYVYIVKGSETVLVDTGFSWKGKAMVRELEAMGIKPQDIKHILLTHHDIDHIGNVFMLQRLTGAQVWASKEDIPYIYRDKERHSFKKYLTRLLNVKVPEGIRPYIQGEKLSGIEVIPTPGHTPGHVCLLYEDVLFIGDLLENKNGKLRPYPRAWNWDNEAVLKSVDRIADIPHKWICPAHGRPVLKEASNWM